MAGNTNESFLSVNSEIGKLKAIMLHKPGAELEKLTPDYLQQLLFDDIPYLKKMKSEHDAFADVFRGNGVEVYYVEDLLTDVLTDSDIRCRFINEMLTGCVIGSSKLQEELREYMLTQDAHRIMEIAITGMEKKDLPELNREYTLVDYVNSEYPLYINPLPNLYFMRDPSSVIGNGLCINSMRTDARRREPVLIKYIFDNHPLLKKGEPPLWYDYTHPANIEGGDILVLSKSTIAIGCSERTSPAAIETVSRNLFAGRAELQQVLAIQIPSVRAFMHLDTVFTMVDHDKFTIYPGIQDKVNIYKITRGKNTHIDITPQDNLVDSLKTSLKLDSIDLIQSGGGDVISAAREQWNDSTNTLAIAPGIVITYDRNEASNRTLREHGIRVIEIDGSELGRGRGGPRCMSMPLIREEI